MHTLQDYECTAGKVLLEFLQDSSQQLPLLAAVPT
jgi:hypothetical protein